MIYITPADYFLALLNQSIPVLGVLIIGYIIWDWIFQKLFKREKYRLVEIRVTLVNGVVEEEVINLNLDQNTFTKKEVELYLTKHSEDMAWVLGYTFLKKNGGMMRFIEDKL